jgi:hypothetical protein
MEQEEGEGEEGEGRKRRGREGGGERKRSVCFRVTRNQCSSDVPTNTDGRSTDMKLRATQHWL